MPSPSIVARRASLQDIDHRLLVDLLLVIELGQREERHHHLLRQRQAGGVIERDVAAVGDDPIDELDRPRLERQRRVALVERLRDVVRKRGNRLVEDVVLVQGDDAQPPAGAAEVLAVGVDANGVPGKLAEQRAETRDERPVDVVGEQHEVGALSRALCRSPQSIRD